MKSLLHFTKTMAMVIGIVITLGSCSNKTSFMTSSVVPAAEGTVKIKNDKNNNYAIELNVIRLAEPGRLSPPKNHYVVWVETQQNGVKNIGQLKTSSGLFSKTLKSSLETVTSFEPREIMITAEDDPAQQYPGSVVVLRTGSLK